MYGLDDERPCGSDFLRVPLVSLGCLPPVSLSCLEQLSGAPVDREPLDLEPLDLPLSFLGLWGLDLRWERRMMDSVRPILKMPARFFWLYGLGRYAKLGRLRALAVAVKERRRELRRFSRVKENREGSREGSSVWVRLLLGALLGAKLEGAARGARGGGAPGIGGPGMPFWGPWGYW